MAQRIKNKSELPEWFRLKKYSMAKTLDAAGWYVQLSIRARCLSYLTQRENISGVLNLIREAPIIEQSLHGVHSLTVHELYLAAINMEESRRIQARAFFEAILGVTPENRRDTSLFSRQKTAFLYEPAHRVLRKPLDQALLGINLLLPDRELVEQFKAHLPELREECGATVFKEKWHRPDFAEWARLGVLPYLDLMIWEKEIGAKITYQVMEDAIFSSPEGSEDRVRKTTAPKAKELISKKSLAFLRAQPLLEQGGQRTG